MERWSEAETILISAIEHFSYCPRQYALIHIEKVFDENIFTLRGQRVHERVDEPEAETVEGAVVERALPLWSQRLGLQGKADVVEFREDGSIYPVEYKYGPRREKLHDDLQLCAQALCLEEMFSRSVTKGAIYHYSSRRRREVEFDERLRARIEEILAGIREVQSTGELPPPFDDARCPNCSLIDACMPSALRSLRIPGQRERLFVPVPKEEIT